MVRWIGPATIIVALVAISACGGDTSDTGSPEDGSTTTAGVPETDTENGEASGFDYVPWGPDDPPIPSQYAALAASSGSAPRCDDLADAQPGGAFWEIALEVCRAIAEDGDWPAETTVPAPPRASNDYQACLDEELAQMLGKALRWHADHPGKRPNVIFPAHSDRSPCQARIYAARVLSEADLEPGEGLPEGIAIAITGSAMDQDPSVTVDGQPVEFTGDFDVDQPEGDGLTTVVVLAPAGDQPRTATIEVSTYRGLLTTSVDLPGTEENAPTDTSNPTPSDDGTDDDLSATEPPNAQTDGDLSATEPPSESETTQ